MESFEKDKAKRSLTRRDFARKSIIAIAAAGSAGLIGYSAFNTKKLKTINNYLRIGHCAPSVMQTLIDIHHSGNEDLVLLSGAMAGGIAGPSTECGVLTAPLMFMGYMNKEAVDPSGRLKLIAMAQAYSARFGSENKASSCELIRNRGMHSCKNAVHDFYDDYSWACANPLVFRDEIKESYSFLLENFEKEDFHCAHNVLRLLEGRVKVSGDMLASTWIFAGGIAMMNRTCGALAGGVAALSSLNSMAENSYARVSRMNRLLRKKSSSAMDEDINNYNRAINQSDVLGEWFRREFGSLSCRDIWQYDFSSLRDSESFITGRCTKQCRLIAGKVAEQLVQML